MIRTATAIWLTVLASLFASPAAAQFRIVEGTVDWPEGTRITRTMQIEVTVSDIGRGSLGPRLLALQILNPDVRPIGFRLQVDPDLAPAGGEYRVDARLIDGRNTLYAGSQDLRLDPVRDGGPPAITLRNPALARSGSETPVNRRWKLQDFTRRELPPFAVVLIEFNDDGTARGNTGCNNFTSRATVTAETMAFSPASMTRRGCIPQLSEVERHFLSVLNKTVSWSITEGNLRLHDASGLALARFRDDF